MANLIENAKKEIDGLLARAYEKAAANPAKRPRRHRRKAKKPEKTEKPASKQS